VTTTVFGGRVVYDAASPGAARPAAAAASTTGLSHDSSVSCLDEGLCCCALSENLRA
jgi:hypothetical protein